MTLRIGILVFVLFIASCSCIALWAEQNAYFVVNKDDQIDNMLAHLEGEIEKERLKNCNSITVANTGVSASGKVMAAQTKHKIGNARVVLGGLLDVQGCRFVHKITVSDLTTENCTYLSIDFFHYLSREPRSRALRGMRISKENPIHEMHPNITPPIDGKAISEFKNICSSPKGVYISYYFR